MKSLIFGGAVTALRTLTVLPVPGRDTEHFSRSLFWFPVAGLLLGLLQVVVGYTGYRFGWPELSSAMIVLGGTALTRGMHVDGFADMADGFWGGKTAEARLRIMKDPSVGSFGAIAISGMMLLKWVAVLKLVELEAFGLVVAGVILARWVQVILASALPYARSEGGTAQAFVNGAGWPHIVVTTMLTLLFLLPFLYAEPYAFVVALLASLFAALLTGLLSYRKIGGVTGDVLGAGSELTELFVWTAGALSLLQSI